MFYCLAGLEGKLFITLSESGTAALQDYVTGPLSRSEYTSGEPRSLQEAWAAGDMAVYPYAKSLATKTSISGLVIQKEWVQSLMEPNGEPTPDCSVSKPMYLWTRPV